MIQCDAAGCREEATWVDQEGRRWCDDCKRDQAKFERSLNLHSDAHTKFRREKR